MNKDKEQRFKKNYSLQDIYDAVEYGFWYATESQNDGYVPKGNTLQWLLHRQQQKYPNINLELVERLKTGEIAIRNNGTLEQLQEIMLAGEFKEMGRLEIVSKNAVISHDTWDEKNSWSWCGYGEFKRYYPEVKVYSVKRFYKNE